MQKEAGSSSTKQSSIGLPTQVLSEEAKDEYRRACEQELEDLMFTGALATEPPESRGVIKGNQIWVVFPNNELVAVEINSSAHLAQLLHLASQLSTTIGPIHDVYATHNGKASNPNIPLVDQGIGEGSYVRVHYRLRGGAPKRGRQECHSFVEGRCIYMVQGASISTIQTRINASCVVIQIMQQLSAFIMEEVVTIQI